MIPSPGLAGWPNRSELLHQAVERLVDAPQIAGKLDHPTSLQVDAVTTQDCSADWHYLTLKVKILSDEVNKTQSQLLFALFQYVRWVVAAAKRHMFALGKGLVFRWDWDPILRSHIAVSLPRSSHCQRAGVCEAVTGQHGSGCFPVLSWDPDRGKRGYLR
jgi:hypothetical protein